MRQVVEERVGDRGGQEGEQKGERLAADGEKPMARLVAAPAPMDQASGTMPATK